MASRSEFAAAVVILAVILAGYSAVARDLRPSDHGLAFQTSPPGNDSKSVRSFFNGGGSSASSSSDASRFPEATNFTGSLPPSWWKIASSPGGSGGRRLGRALVVASLVCGVTGVALLVAAGLLYLFKRRRKSKLNAAFRGSDGVFSSNDNNNDINNRNANKLQLVAVPVVRNS